MGPSEFSSAGLVCGLGAARSAPGHPTEVVLEALDVVLAEVLPVLDLDEDELGLTDVLDPVGGTPRDVDRLARAELDLTPVQGDRARPETTNQCSDRRACLW